jgi:pimeloyl-ACP methyl ester carboxylesterase
VAPHISIAGIVSSLATSGAIHDETEAAAMTGRLDEITVPSLFLWGKYDFVVPPALGESAFSLVSSQDKELVVFERSGHSPMDTEPEGFVVAVEGFVERNK